MLPAPDLANAVTAFCTSGAGATTFAFAHLVAPRHPRRWMAVWLALFATGLMTLGWHGWGVVMEDGRGEIWRVLDVATNLLLAFLLQLAVAGDFYSRRFRMRLAIGSGVLNMAAIAGLAHEAITRVKTYAIPLGDFGGFYPAEAMLIADAFLVVGLFYAARRKIASEAMPLLYGVAGIFLAGLGLATAGGSVVIGRVGAMHALWHMAAAFGFLFLWAFVHVRLRAAERNAGASSPMRESRLQTRSGGVA